MWLTMIAAGLGTARVVNWMKEFLPIDLTRRGKALATALVGTGIVLGLLWGRDTEGHGGPSVRNIIEVALGAHGIAMATHQMVAAAQAQRDIDRLSVLKQLRNQPGGESYLARHGH